MEHVAIDVGASGGTMMAGNVSAEGFDFEIVRRFDNRPVEEGDRYVWDVDALTATIETGLGEAASRGEFATVGINTWGVDFGLYDSEGLMRSPYAYRDPTVSDTLEDILDVVSKREIFELTGINHWNVPNTLWQYHALVNEEAALLADVETILLMPQVLARAFGGRPSAEETIASTTQLFDPQSRMWAEPLFEALNLPMEPLPTVEEPGTTIGTVETPAVENFATTPDIVLPASHDTAGAVAGLPLDESNKTFLSTGSWFIPGVELDEPVLSDEAFEFGVSNELGVENTVRFLKNVNGFFVLEECREYWCEQGQTYDYDALIAAASEADRYGPLIDTDDDRLTIEGSMPDHVATVCRETEQAVPSDEGAVTRTILESLAVKTAIIVDTLESIAGVDSDVLYVGGGGVRNELFLQMLASALDRPVRTGPIEATAVGNILTQATAAGEINDLERGRELLEASLETCEFEPTDVTYFEQRRTKFQSIFDTKSTILR